MNHRQVALQTGQAVKKHLSIPGEVRKTVPYKNCKDMYPVDTTTAEGATKDRNKLHDDHVVGDVVRVTHHRRCGGGTLLLPLLQNHVEDKDAEREEEEDVCDAEWEEDEGTWSGDEAMHQKREEGVGGGTLRKKKGVIGDGQRVGWHI